MEGSCHGLREGLGKTMKPSAIVLAEIQGNLLWGMHGIIPPLPHTYS
jgi:hypothetical protein